MKLVVAPAQTVAGLGFKVITGTVVLNTTLPDMLDVTVQPGRLLLARTV